MCHEILFLIVVLTPRFFSWFLQKEILDFLRQEILDEKESTPGELDLEPPVLPHASLTGCPACPSTLDDPS